jgi:hypothetical protein
MIHLALKSNDHVSESRNLQEIKRESNPKENSIISKDIETMRGYSTNTNTPLK